MSSWVPPRSASAPKVRGDPGGAIGDVPLPGEPRWGKAHGEATEPADELVERYGEETTGTLPCGDLFTQMDAQPAVSHDSPLEGTAAAEDAFGYSCLGPTTVVTVERLAELDPTTLATMHGPAHTGSGGTRLRDLAGSYADRIASTATTG